MIQNENIWVTITTICSFKTHFWHICRCSWLYLQIISRIQYILRLTWFTFITYIKAIIFQLGSLLHFLSYHKKSFSFFNKIKSLICFKYPSHSPIALKLTMQVVNDHTLCDLNAFPTDSSPPLWATQFYYYNFVLIWW